MTDSIDGRVDWKASYFKVLEENNALKMTLQAELKSDEEFAALLDLLMVIDPWPEQVNRNPIKNMADDEAERRGYKHWIDAYHNFERE